MDTQSLYRHRHNADGSWDSICLTCFQNAVVRVEVNQETDLSKLESRHTCEYMVVFSEPRRGDQHPTHR